MKKIFFFFAILLSVVVSAQSNHTITIDGNNDFYTGAERFNTTSGSTLQSYLTWDDNSIFIGLSGSSVNGSVTDNSRVYHIYIDTDPQANPTGGTGSVLGQAWRWTPTLPFSANYHYTFKTSDNTETRSVYSNSTWGAASFTTSNWKANGYWELKLDRATLGSPKQINIIVYVEEDWSGGSICGGTPSNIFTNNSTGGSITLNNHWLNLSLIDQVSPNLTYNLDNYSKTIRLGASVSGLTDNTAMAGISTNATDGYDAGVDIAKAPTPPSNYVEVYFPHVDWTATKLGPKFARDIRKTSNLDSTLISYDFSINTDKASATVTFSANLDDFSGTTYPISLYDITADVTTNLRTNGSYTYNSGASAGARNFRLILGTSFSSPKIVSNVSSVNYGSLKLGKDSTVTVTITNQGDSTLHVTNVASTNNSFTFTGGTTHDIAKNQSVNIPVKFAPAVAGAISGKLQITSNDPATSTLEVSLSGTGLPLLPIVSVSKSSLDFGNIKTDYDTTVSFKVYNTGDAALTVTSVTSNNSAFAVTTASSYIVGVNDSATVSLKFKPILATGYTGKAIIINNDATNDTIEVSLVGTGISNNVSTSLADGWSLISIPVKPANPTPNAVIGSQISPFVMYGYLPTSGYYSVDTINSGSGYWLGIESAATLNVTGVASTETVTKSLNSGWNIVATPYLRAYPKAKVYFEHNGTTYNADDAVTNGLIQNTYYGYNKTSSAYVLSDTLKQWSGYWFPTLVAGVKMMVMHDSTSGSPLLKSNPPVLATSTTNWNASIIAETNVAKDNLLTFGVAPNATDGFDTKFDNVKPPISPIQGAVETYFEYSNWINLFSKYGADIKAPFVTPEAGKNWNFKVRATSTGTVTLKWNDIVSRIPEEIRAKYSFKLNGSGASDLNMLTTLQYSFNAQQNQIYSFSINSVAVDVKDGGLNKYSFNLSQNYPNPFNPSTTISYTMPKAGNVSLKVYDILGNVVRILADEYVSEGEHSVQFDASDLTSGVYFYKLVMGESSMTKKLVLMK